MALEIEARARFLEERPHAVVGSIHPDKVRSMDAINQKLFRRFYRRARNQCDIDGGFGFFHAYRIKEPRKRALRRRGYGAGGDRGGYWKGVRDDALELGDWRKYVKWGPHAHSIGFPGFIEPHESDDFLIQKYTLLEDLSSVIAHVRYLLSHGAVRERDDECRITRPWGAFHHSSDVWAGAEQELSESDYRSLASEVASLIGMEWSADDGLHYEDSCECPECGTPKEDFIDLWDLPERMGTGQLGEPFGSDLGIEAREFFREIVEILHTADDPRIYEGDIRHPDSVAKWIDDGPPPDE